MVRSFTIYTEPSIADPAWQVPLVEVMSDGSPRHYGEFSILKSLIADCEMLAAQKEGAAQELDRICALFQVTSVFELEKLAACSSLQREEG